MELTNAKYKNQMISIDICIFSFINNKLNVLLGKRKGPYFENFWSLIGGGVYNNETCENAVVRELDEKLKVKNIVPILSGVFSEPKRDIRFRNISISYYCVVKLNEISYDINLEKFSEIKWFELGSIPKLAFDHNDIIEKSVELLKEKIYDISYIKKYLPKKFTLVQLQEIYESVLQTRLDKRNFRRKLNSLNVLINTNEKNINDSRKKSTIYEFK